MNSSSFGESNWQHYWKIFTTKAVKLGWQTRHRSSNIVSQNSGILPLGITTIYLKSTRFGVLDKEGTEGPFIFCEQLELHFLGEGDVSVHLKQWRIHYSVTLSRMSFHSSLPDTTRPSYSFISTRDISYRTASLSPWASSISLALASGSLRLSYQECMPIYCRHPLLWTNYEVRMNLIPIKIIITWWNIYQCEQHYGIWQEWDTAASCSSVSIHCHARKYLIPTPWVVPSCHQQGAVDDILWW